jgi:hypothetical protein
MAAWRPGRGREGDDETRRGNAAEHGAPGRHEPDPGGDPTRPHDPPAGHDSAARHEPTAVHDPARHRSLPHRPDDPNGADALIQAFATWAAEHRAGQAAEARSRERWLRHQVAETATLTGTLVDLAEQGADATLVVGTRNATGRLVGVGGDGCVLADRAGGVTIVALARIAAIRVAGRRRGTGEATGDRAPAGEWTLLDALGALASERTPVQLSLAGGEVVRGDLVSVGEDVLTLRTGAGDTWTHVAVAAVETCSPV